MRDNNIISILDVLLTETTLVTKANPDSVRIWDRYRRGPRFVRILDWSNLGPPHRHYPMLKGLRFSGVSQDLVVSQTGYITRNCSEKT